MKVENNNIILSEQTVTNEYQIPVLVELNSVSEAMGSPVGCHSGTSANHSCFSGGVAVT